MLDELDAAVSTVVELAVAARRAAPRERAALVALSGIDASGKGVLAARAAAELQARGLRVASLGVDPWLNLPKVRFSTQDPAGHFYRHALRLDEMFRRLVLPLRDSRGIRIEADAVEETATSFHRRLYEHHDVDLVLLEGIFLLKREHRRHYDASAWVDCTFETALERAVGRAQEGLPPPETAEAYRSLYFPAQRLHLAIDDPVRAATTVVSNDPRLGLSGTVPVEGPRRWSRNNPCREPASG